MQNWSETLLSQYCDSPTITALIESINDAIDPTVDLANFYEKIWNIKTAVGYGLDVWGQIVGVSRYLDVNEYPTYMGFKEAFTIPTADTGIQPFNQAPMYNGPLINTVYSLSDPAYRALIMVKAAANICNLSAKVVNNLLRTIVGNAGVAYVQDTGDMQQRYVFEFNLTPVQFAIVTRSGVIPRSAGVQAYAIQYIPYTVFGFNEGQGQPFGSGTFFSQSEISNAI